MQVSNQEQLTTEQKRSVILLSAGTFLELFDTMLYIHMAVLLNELFFAKSDQHTTALISALAFCSTFVFRPIGALVLGWIGDNIGRKATVVITTLIMASSCLVMTIIPTYAQVGVLASYLVTFCRIMQSMSAMGELVGAELYLTESIKPPKQYFAVGLVVVFGALGGTLALIVSSLVTSNDMQWRWAFLFGALIAIVGSIARIHLRETPDFADAKRRITKNFQKFQQNTQSIKSNPLLREKVSIKTSLAFFLVQCAWTIGFYLAYIYLPGILYNVFSYTPGEIIKQNLVVSVVEVISFFTVTYLSNWINPFIILRVKTVIFTIFIIFVPYMLNNITTPFELLLIQCFTIAFTIAYVPAIPIFYKHFPVFKRFTYTSFLYAVSRAIMYVVISFGSVYLTTWFHYWGILFIAIPLIIGFVFGILHFEKLERQKKLVL